MIHLRQILRHPLCELQAWVGRVRGPAPIPPEAAALHAAAETAGQNHYRDPWSGRQVATARALARLGGCCGLGCRHCPYPPEARIGWRDGGWK